MEKEMKIFENFERGWFVVEVRARMAKSVKLSLQSMISRSNLENVIFDVAISPIKEYGNFVLVDMIASPRAISSILRLQNVKKFLGSNHNPLPLTEDEFASMV